MATEDSTYLNWIRGLRCWACDGHPPSHAHHHTGRRGAGQRAHDRDAMPLCAKCHRDFHDGRARFASMNNEQRRAFQDKAVKHLQNVYTDTEAM